MEKDIHDKKQIEQFCEKQFDNINKWLSFAEAKNAALIVFNVAMLKIANDLYKISDVASIIMLLLISFSLYISLKSFIPNLSKSVEQIENNSNTKEPFNEKKTIENLIFYGNIAQISRKEILLRKIKEKYFSNISDEYLNDPYLLDISEEILINSKITLKKYKSFSNALYLDIIVIIIALITAFCR